MIGQTCYALPDTILGPLSELVRTRLGLNFPVDRWSDLERGLRAACLAQNSADVDDFAQRLLSVSATRDELFRFANHLTVGETYFFREQRALDLFENQIVPELAAKARVAQRGLRVWSAGCASGEEPYSIAVLLSRVTPSVRFSILATDLNQRSLDKAVEGVYGEWSFRGTPQWVKARYFSPTPDGRWALDPSIKDLVTFAHANLADDWLPCQVNGADVIFCRNVLMYFSPEVARQAVRRLYDALSENGWLIVSPAETSSTLFADFKPVSFDGVTLYRKTNPIFDHAEFHAPALFEVLPAAAPIDPPPLCTELKSSPTVHSTPKREADRTPAMVRLARLHADQGRLKEAFRWCEKAIAGGRNDSRTYYLRATILVEQGSLEEAARSLQRVVYLDPEFVMGHLTLGNLAIKRGRKKESAKHFTNAANLLAGYGQSDILPESGGLTASRLRELISRQTNG